MHYEVLGNTAAEVIFNRIDSKKRKKFLILSLF